MKTMLGMLCALALLAGTARAEKIAYLGVATMPLDPVAAYQLGLAEGVGLAVVEVAEDGAVKGKLVPHDILQKLDDQILTSPEQLAVLVRGHQPGDTVKLTALRKGKTETLKVTLAETDARRLAQTWRGYGGGGMLMPPMPGAPDNAAQDWQRQWQQWHQQMQRQRQNEDEQAPPRRERGPRIESQTESHTSSVITETRDGLTVTLTDRDGQKTVRAEEDGKVIVADKPANTAEQLKALPDKVRERITEMQKQIKIDQPAAPRPGKHHSSDIEI